MRHLQSFLCFIIKSKLTTYLEMKTNGLDSAQERTGYCSAQKKEIKD